MNHIRYSKISNFKKFKSIEFKDIGMFNLIIGDNGIGKTSVLESFLVEKNNLKATYSNLVAALWQRLKLRAEVFSKTNILTEFYLNDVKNNQIEIIRTFAENNDTSKSSIFIKDVEDFDKEEQKFLVKNIQYRVINSVIIQKVEGKLVEMFPLDIFNTDQNDEIGYNPFIPFHVGYGDDLVEYYSKFIQNNREINNSFIKSLSFIISKIESIAVSSDKDKGSEIVIWLKELEKPIPLGMLGEGSARLFRILAEIIVCRNKILLIDEIDTGIHYSRFENFMSVILKTAKLYNVQIFATTHSIECLKYLTKAIEESNDEYLIHESRIFSLIQSDKGEVVPIVYRFPEFKYSIENELEIRGGN